MLGEIYMNLILKRTTLLAALTAFILSITSFASARDLNVEGFTGTIDTTLTSGFSIRVADRNCNLQDGYSNPIKASDLTTTGFVSLAGNSYAAVYSTKDADTQAYILNQYSKNNAGCTFGQKTDGYGNAATSQINIGNVNNDDGNLNFDQGDVVDATQRFFTSIRGRTDSGIGVNLSLAGSVNPVLDITTPAFKALSSEAEDVIESDLSLLDAYITTSFDTADSFLDVQIGRFVTSWGEATFIPVGMNGLVTNALDLTKLRAPGSAIREALTPTEQITLSTSTADGWGIEAYYQFSASQVELDPSGSYFGNEVVGAGGFQILAAAAEKMENNVRRDTGCTFTATVIQGATCNATTLALHTAEATRDFYGTEELGRQSQIGASATLWGSWLDTALAADFGSKALIGEGSALINPLVRFTHANTTANKDLLANTIYTAANIVRTDYKKAATVELRAHTNKFVDAKDDGQFGLKLSKYFDNIGDGLDVGFYYANYHSKVPYQRIVGKGGVLAGDHVGLYRTEYLDYVGDTANGGGDGSAFGHAQMNTLLGADNAGKFIAYAVEAERGAVSINPVTISDTLSGDNLAQAQAFLAAANGAYSSGICGAFTYLAGASAGIDGIGEDDVAYSAAAGMGQDLQFGVLINGNMQHAPNACTGAGKAALASSLAYFKYASTLLPAITPLNMAQYQFIYPEDNQVFGMSFNTNVNGITVQGEVAYRPDFPLATSTGDQINQISDASGSTAALSIFAIESFPTTSAKAQALKQFQTEVDTVLGSGALQDLVVNNRRSSLPDLGVAPDTDYYSTPFINYDVMSFDIGTTAAFPASHPITLGLGADSVVFLTELAAVAIESMDPINKGFVARSGFNEGNGEHLCLGIFARTSQANIDAINTALAANTTLAASLPDAAEIQIDYNLDGKSAKLTNTGASIVDALFGNGNYCESKMDADEFSATYRLVGSATYNNFNNTPWSLSPSVSFAHDFLGHGPSSLGGFVEDKMSLSLGVTAKNNSGMTVGLNYVNQMGTDIANTSGDRDFVSANVSYAF
jgi:hypothetical protein